MEKFLKTRENELYWFDIHIKYIEKLKEACDSKKYYIYYDLYKKYINFFDTGLIEIDELPEDTEFLFTVERLSVDTYGGACQICGTPYPSILMRGKYIKKNKILDYVGYIDSYNSFSCICTNGIILRRDIPEINIILVYTGNEFVHENISLKFNLKLVNIELTDHLALID